MNFKIGQKVVCIYKGKWRDCKTKEPCHIYPEQGEICTIESVHVEGFLIFEEYQQMVPKKTSWFGFTKKERVSYVPHLFRPVLGDAKKEEMEYETKELSKSYLTQN